LESALVQCFIDFEIIVVDDHSRDGTLEYLKGIRDKRIRYIARHERGGGAAARNTGIAAAKGKYLAFLDDDDAWHESKLQRQIEVMQRSPDVGLVYTGVIKIYQDNGRVFRTFVPQHRGDISKILLARNVIGTTSSVMIRRTAMDGVGGFDESFPSCQDWDLYLRLSKHWLVDFVGAPLVDYYLHPVRITRDAASRIAGRRMILEKYRSEIVGDRRILSGHHVALGRLCCQAGQYYEGRRMLLRAVRENLCNVEAYKHLLPVLFGGRLYWRLLFTQRQFKTRLFQRYRLAWQEKGQSHDE
jgi:glycosyltransferase involved in cell wall biosynthesis